MKYDAYLLLSDSHKTEADLYSRHFTNSKLKIKYIFLIKTINITKL